jgi:formylglycine-generating enzyme required for sulfatase activity
MHPGGNTWDATVVPVPEKRRTLSWPGPVDARPGGAGPFGVHDLVGNIWQSTDEHSRADILRGGSIMSRKGRCGIFRRRTALTSMSIYC